MKTLQQLRTDARIDAITRVYDEDYKYEVWFDDGWTIDDGSHICWFNSIAEINAALDELEHEDIIETRPELFDYNYDECDKPYRFAVKYTAPDGSHGIYEALTTPKKCWREFHEKHAGCFADDWKIEKAY